MSLPWGISEAHLSKSELLREMMAQWCHCTVLFEEESKSHTPLRRVVLELEKE